MSGPSRGTNAQCIHCGKLIGRHLRHCPYCREAQGERRLPSVASSKAPTQGHFRSGLLLMMMAATAQYFLSGNNPLLLPNEMNAPLLRYVVPTAFVSGLAMSVWGFFQRVRA
jgi:hypothetical protein